MKFYGVFIFFFALVGSVGGVSVYAALLGFDLIDVETETAHAVLVIGSGAVVFACVATILCAIWDLFTCFFVKYKTIDRRDHDDNLDDRK